MLGQMHRGEHVDVDVDADADTVLAVCSTKLLKKGELLHKLVELVDRVLVGGALSLAFQQVLGKMTVREAYRGHLLGTSIREAAYAATRRAMA